MRCIIWAVFHESFLVVLWEKTKWAGEIGEKEVTESETKGCIGLEARGLGWRPVLQFEETLRNGPSANCTRAALSNSKSCKV